MALNPYQLNLGIPLRPAFALARGAKHPTERSLLMIGAVSLRVNMENATTICARLHVVFTEYYARQLELR
jgi:hypothetical protein